MTETRPRPEYGEYATPEEQAEAMGTPTAPDVPAAAVDYPPPAVTDSAAPAATAAGPGKPRRWDLVISMTLIIFGVYVTISGLSTYSDLAASLTQIYGMYGYDGTYPNSDQARVIGTALNVINPVLLVLTIWLTYRRTRLGRISFWIPLVAGVVSTVVSTILLMVLLFADPAFVQFMTETMGA